MEKEKVTIYTTSEFFGSVQSVEGYLIEHGRRKYAQYEKAPFVKFIPKGKRKIRVIQKSYKPYLIIVKGWNNIKPASMFGNPQYNNQTGVTTRESIYSSFDDRFKTDFDALIEQYTHLFIADYREQAKLDKSII